MKTSLILTAILTSFCLGALAMSTTVGSKDVAQQRKKAHKAFKSGNFRDAYDALRGLLLDKTVLPAGNDLIEASSSLQRLNRTSEIDELLESAVKTLELIAEGDKAPRASREVPAGGEARVDWLVKVLDEGQATIHMKALTDEESDAMEQKFPCYIHGALKMEARSGVIRGFSPLPRAGGGTACAKPPPPPPHPPQRERGR